MLSLLWLIPVTLALGAGGVALFSWAVRSGQSAALAGRKHDPRPLGHVQAVCAFLSR